MQHVRRTTADQKRAGAGHRGKGFGGTRRLIALLLLVPTVMVQAATATSADAAVVAGFEIDGNTPVDGGGLDWATTGTHSTDPTGNVDDSNFTGGSKEFQNPNAWDEGTGTSTDQGDISDVWSHFITGAQTWGFLGFQRIKETGTMTFMVEFNQKANLPKQTDDSVQFRPDRTVNDLLLRFEQDGNDSFELTAAYKWTQSAAGSFASGCFTVPGYATPSAWCPTSVAGSGFAGATSVDGLFAEAAVNLSSFDSAGDCRGAFGTMNVRSFAGDSESSSLLDFVGGVGINVPATCGQLVINKKDQFGTAVGGATFTITPNPIPGVTGPAAAELVVTDGAAPGIDTVADGTVTISPAKPGTYTVEETATPAGYQPDTTVHTDVVVGDSGTSVATVAFLNKLYFKPLDIANQASGSYGVEYDWLVHKTVVGASSKTVDEGQSATFQYQVELEALPEGPPAGKEVHGTATVTNPNSASHPDMRATLSFTGDLACHFLPSNGAIDVDPGTAGVQVDAGDGSTAYDYTCDPGAGALVGGTTTAEVSWDQSTYPQAGAHPGEATAQASYAITVQPKIDELASVTDRFDGNPATPIGAAQYTWSDVWGADNHRVVVATYSSPAVGGTAGSCTDYPNVARVDESDTDDFDTSEQTVTLCVDLDDLVVTKTANPTFARDYDWSIEKSVTGDSSQTVPEGTPATFEYDVVVTPSGGTDTEFVVAGAIKVNNPNQRTITGVSLSDSLPGGTCTIDKPDGPLSIPAGNTSFPYTCVMSDATASTTGTNSATATWDASAFHGTSGTASGQAAFDFADAVADTTDETATVTDTQVELGDVPGGVLVNAADGPQTFTYTKDFDGEPGACTSYDNTAKVVATDSHESDSDTQTVEVCVEKPLELAPTATADLARDYAWSIGKVADATQRTVDGSVTV